MEDVEDSGILDPGALPHDPPRAVQFVMSLPSFWLGIAKGLSSTRSSFGRTHSAGPATVTATPGADVPP